MMRILACFIVIGCHVRMEPVINGGLDKELLFLHGFYDDGVAIFFMIIGFFLPTIKEPFWRSTAKTFCRILIPVFLLMLCTQLLNGWIINEASFLDCLAHPTVDLVAIIRYFVSLNFQNYSAHLWYISAYLRIVIMLPLLKLLTLDHPISSRACKWIMIISTISMLVTDLQMAFLSKAGVIGTFMIFDVSVTYVVIGYWLYKNQHKLKNNWKYRTLFAGGMFGVNILRFILQCILFDRSLENNHFYYWNTSIALIFSVCFICFFLTFARDSGQRWTRLINYIGAKTYFIYLIHFPVFTFLDYRGVRNWVYSVTIRVTPNLVTKLGYSILYPIIIFTCCLSIAVVIDIIRFLLRSLQHRLTTAKA